MVLARLSLWPFGLVNSHMVSAFYVVMSSVEKTEYIFLFHFPGEDFRNMEYQD